MTYLPWTYEETLVAFYVYCIIPFKNSNKNHPLIIEFANLLGRSPSALNMKIGNLGRLAPSLKSVGISGLQHGAKTEEQIWREFNENPEKILRRQEEIIEQLRAKPISTNSEHTIITVDEMIRERKIRTTQTYFREIVLSAYNYRCCITGTTCSDLLEACHIVGWAENLEERLNPRNGLCLMPFFHKAYDLHYLGISPDLQISIARSLLKGTRAPFSLYLQQLDGTRISPPSKFLPHPNLLEQHYKQFLESAL